MFLCCVISVVILPLPQFILYCIVFTLFTYHTSIETVKTVSLIFVTITAVFYFLINKLLRKQISYNLFRSIPILLGVNCNKKLVSNFQRLVFKYFKCFFVLYGVQDMKEPLV